MEYDLAKRLVIKIKQFTLDQDINVDCEIFRKEDEDYIIEMK